MNPVCINGQRLEVLSDKHMAGSRSMYKKLTRLLMVTLGVSWLSLAITPCLLAAVEEINQHDCCPQRGVSSGSPSNPDQVPCDNCDMVQPTLKSANQFIQSSTSSIPDYQAVIIDRDYKPVTDNAACFHKVPAAVLTATPPPLRFRVLLI